MAQVAHLPPAQQQALLTQVMAQHQRALAQMRNLQRAAAPVQQNVRPGGMHPLSMLKTAHAARLLLAEPCRTHAAVPRRVSAPI
jgi:prephenate dehydratase